MVERVFQLVEPTTAFDIENKKPGERFYDRLAAKFEAAGYEAGWDAGKGKLPVKLCLLGYANLQVTWDENALPELADKVESILAGVAKRTPNDQDLSEGEAVFASPAAQAVLAGMR